MPERSLLRKSLLQRMQAYVSEITRNYAADGILLSAYTDCQEMFRVFILLAAPQPTAPPDEEELATRSNMAGRRPTEPEPTYRNRINSLLIGGRAPVADSSPATINI